MCSVTNAFPGVFSDYNPHVCPFCGSGHIRGMGYGEMPEDFCLDCGRMFTPLYMWTCLNCQLYQEYHDGADCVRCGGKYFMPIRLH